ncbi:MAG TPA: SMP-30/gluconolactonase/LRE family protein, partial [Limnochordia bacterium]
MARAFSQIVAGLPGAEGPVCDRRGQLYMVVPDEGRVVAIDEGGRVREIARTGGIPAGLQVDRAGELWCADMRRGILRISPNGAVTPVVERFQGAPIRGCNDCVFDRFGNLYFTAPAGSAADRPVGELFCLTAAGALHRLDGGYRFCNGIAVSADGRQLFVAETYTKTVWRFEIGGEGTVGQKTAWARLP